ncbi:hypothetical protein D3C79_1046800 [compost metagenome]
MHSLNLLRIYTITLKNNWMGIVNAYLDNGLKLKSNTNKNISFIKYVIKKSNSRYFMNHYLNYKFLKYPFPVMKIGEISYAGC